MTAYHTSSNQTNDDARSLANESLPHILQSDEWWNSNLANQGLPHIIQSDE